MLGITVSRVAEAALDYFDRELTGKQEAGYYGTGVWRGKLAERLELRGEVRREDFQALLRNEKPQGGRLTARKNTTRLQDGKRVSNRQVGYDWTFGAPKSVSIYLEAADDREMEAICHRALNRTLEKIEADMQCKVRKGGVHEDRSAPGMLMAVFEHRDARPINGIAGPHRHWHRYAINCAFDPIENRFKAGQFRQLIADGGYYQEFWHAARGTDACRLRLAGD
jgi:conjugative relaxase-like TrwC/TraI family protein